MPVSKGRKPTANRPAKKSTRATSASLGSDALRPAQAAAMTDDTGGGLALYHAVYAHESFDDAAEMIFQIVSKAARDFPGKPRHLYLDIDGHRNEAGGFDHDMYELQSEFIMKLLSPWLASFSLPVMPGQRVITNAQQEDVPDHLTITDRRAEES